MAKTKLSESEELNLWLEQLVHPLNGLLNETRQVILASDPRLKERIKWNAPSYYVQADILTFNHREQRKIHLVVHHPAVETVPSPLLEGDFKQRRMVYFSDSGDLKAKAAELQWIIQELLRKEGI